MNRRSNPWRGTACAACAGLAAWRSLAAACPPEFDDGQFVDPGQASAVVSDLNGDGFDDIVVIPSVSASIPSLTATVKLNNHDGTFGAAPSILFNPKPSSVVAADMNGDGHPDLLSAHHRDGSIEVRIGDGAGGFGPAVNTFPAGLALDVVAGDFNGDGVQDAACIDNSLNRVVVLIGAGDGTFGTTIPYLLPSPPEDLACADLNGDSALDLVVLTTANTLWTFFGSGDGTLTTGAVLSVSDNPSVIIAAELSGDQRPDVVLQTTAGTRALLNNGSGALLKPPVTVGSSTGATAVGDIDGDGDLDIIAASGGSSSPRADFYLGNGSGGFTAAVSIELNYMVRSLTTGRIYDHPKLDLVTQEASSGSGGCYVRKNATDFPPVIVTEPADQVSRMKPVQFTVEHDGDAVGYRWMRDGILLSNGGHISGAFTKTLTISPVTSADGAAYGVIVWNYCNSAISRDATLKVFCPADADESGYVNGNDFDRFTELFEAGDAGADFDDNGVVSGEDFDAFVAAFESGC